MRTLLGLPLRVPQGTPAPMAGGRGRRCHGRHSGAGTPARMPLPVPVAAERFCLLEGGEQTLALVFDFLITKQAKGTAH